MAKKITIIGCGPGGADYLTPIATKAAESMDVLAGASRLFDLFPNFKGEKILYNGTAKILQTLEETEGRIGVLVSGDPSFFSLADCVIKHFGIKNCEVITGISSIQVALSRFGLKSNTARIISSHAGIPDVSPEKLKGEEAIILLGGNSNSIDWIESLIHITSSSHDLHICTNLTLPNESIISISNNINSSHFSETRTILVFSRKKL